MDASARRERNGTIAWSRLLVVTLLAIGFGWTLGFGGCSSSNAGSSPNGGPSGGGCNSGPGTCTNPTSANNCRNGAVCERVCATCDYACWVECSTNSQCAGSCDSAGNPLTCSTCPNGVCNAGFSACDIQR